MPKQIQVFVTTECDSPCKHCGLDDELKGQTMDDSLLEQLLNDIVRSSISRVDIVGGEPLRRDYARSRLIPTLKTTKIGKKKVTVISNGSYATNNYHGQRTANDLKRAGVGIINLSMGTGYLAAVPLQVLANAVIGSVDAFGVSSIIMPSLRPTFESDVELVHQLAGLLHKEVRIETRGLKPKEKDLDKIRYVLEHTGQVTYAIGESSITNPLRPTRGAIAVCQMLAVYAGRLTKYYTPEDIFIDLETTEVTEESIGARDGLHCNLRSPAILPDGSLLPCCHYSVINNYKETRLGVYPEMSLTEFGRALSPIVSVDLSQGQLLSEFEFLRENAPEALVGLTVPKNPGYPACNLCTTLQKAHQSQA